MDFNLLETDRKGIMIAFAMLSNTLHFTKVYNQSGLYNIRSNDNQINIQLDLHNHEENSLAQAKTLVEYCYNEREFVLTEISNDYNLLENVFKFVNGLILHIENEGATIEEEKLKHNDISYKPTPTQIAIFYKLLNLDELLAECYEVDDDCYFAMSIARFIADSVNQANLFLDHSELFWGIKTVAVLACAVPYHQDKDMRNFAKELLKFGNYLN